MQGGVRPWRTEFEERQELGPQQNARSYSPVSKVVIFSPGEMTSIVWRSAVVAEDLQVAFGTFKDLMNTTESTSE